MEVLSGMPEELREFAGKYGCSPEDPDLIRRCRMVEDARHDVATQISAAEKRGFERGM